MPSTSLTELIPVLQIAIAPVILISGVGLLLLSLTNRFGRAVDRTREIHREMREAVAAADRQRLAHQVEVIYQRARLIQLSIVLGALSALFAAMLILALFLTALMKWESAFVISLIFICCLATLVASLITYIMDIRLSLKALKVELTRPPEH
jgi:CBS domain containing-hemolysin-like protein